VRVWDESVSAPLEGLILDGVHKVGPEQTAEIGHKTDFGKLEEVIEIL
jgi:hypothetical protein